jgi:hypothetical protein
MAIWSMPFACWIPKATDTHSDRVIPITFRLQQWLHERASVLRYMYTVLFTTVSQTALLIWLYK